MGKVLFMCPFCDGTEDFVLHDGQLACLCGIEKVTDTPRVVEEPPTNYQLIEGEMDSTAGLGKPFSG